MTTQTEIQAVTKNLRDAVLSLRPDAVIERIEFVPADEDTTCDQYEIFATLEGAPRYLLAFEGIIHAGGVGVARYEEVKL